MNIIEIIAEKRINESIGRGEFEDLSGKGLPIDLNAYFKIPPNLRVAYTVLKNAGMDPMELKFASKSATCASEKYQEISS